MALAPTPTGGPTPVNQAPGNVTPDPLTQAPDGNVTADQSGTPGDENNGGQAYDYATFWNGSGEPASDDPSGSPSASPADSPTQPPAGTPQATPMEQLTGVLDGLQFDGIMTPEVLEEFGEGKFDKFNAGVSKQLQNGVKESLFLTAKMMDQLQTKMMSAMEKKFGELNTADKRESALFESLPFAKNKALRPIAKGVFAQALTNTKGDESQALEMTTQFFKETMKLSADDLDFDVSQKGQHVDSFAKEEDGQDWATALLGRE